MRAPNKIVTSEELGRTWELQEILYPNDKQERYYHTLFYTTDGSRRRCILRPQELEKQFSKHGRPEPVANIVQQGKYDCAPAAFTMLLGCSFYESKQAHAFAGWNGDNNGCTSDMSKRAAQLLGYDLIETTVPTGKPCLVTVPSLNFKRRFHAICWNGTEMLDPNYGRNDRHSYGTEWAPWTVGARSFQILVTKEELLQQEEENETYMRNVRWQRAAYKR